jgi:hypothetical protein
MDKYEGMERVSVKEFAARVNTTDTTVNRYISKGVISSDAIQPTMDGKRGFIVWEVAKKDWEKHHGPIKERKIKRNRTEKVKEKESKGIVEAEEHNDEIFDLEAEGMTLLEAEKRKKVADAKKAELQLQELEGSLVPIANVHKSLFQFGAEIRDAIQSVPDRVIDSILASDSRNEALNILVMELNKSLLALSDKNRKLKK